MLDNFRKIDLVWNNAYEKLKNVRTAQYDEKGRKLVVQVTNDGDIVDLRGVGLKLVTIDGIEVGGRNLLKNSNDFSIFRPFMGSSINHQENQPIEEAGISEGTRLIISGGTTTLKTTPHISVGNDYKGDLTYSFWAKNNGDEPARFRVNGFVQDDGALFSNEILGPNEARRIAVHGRMRDDFDWCRHQIHQTQDEQTIDVTLAQMKLEKGNKATDWTPAPEDLQFPFDLIDAQKGIYELYFPKFFVDRYTGKTKVFLELTTKDFSVTSEPFYINVFEGVK